MSKAAYKNKKNSRDSGRYIQLPLSILDSITYQSLSFSARCLLIDVASQFKGENNGTLVACDKFLKPRGWVSKATISKALKELLESGLLVMTRQGMRPNKASYFGVAWQGMGSRVIESQLDINGRMFEQMRHEWKAHERDLQTTNQPPKTGLIKVTTVPKTGLEHPCVSPKNEPISLKKSSLLPQYMGTF